MVLRSPYYLAKRLFDVSFALLGLVLLSPLFALIAVGILLDNGRPILFRHPRVGKRGIPFELLKFRTMRQDASNTRPVTIRDDSRVTQTGRWLRRHKLDELPQLVNVVRGEMSFVGPRPEVAQYVEQYTEAQRAVLSVRPGITDPASLKFFDESAHLPNDATAEREYVERILPQKLQLNLEYLTRRSFAEDIRIILRTVAKLFSR